MFATLHLRTLLQSIFLIYFGVTPSLSLQITGVFGGGSYVNGSTERVILDCRYTVLKNESVGLVIKWYHNEGLAPVYQWIQGSTPQALGILKDRLDLSYKSSADELKTHSSLVFVRPTVELSGKYTCSVSTYLAEQRRSGVLVMYTPASRFKLKITKPSVTRLTISCVAEGVHPEPKMELTKLEIKNKRRTILETNPEVTRDARTNLYTVTDSVTFLGYELVSDMELGCLLTIPKTNYKLQETLIHRAIDRNSSSSTSTAASTMKSSAPAPSTPHSPMYLVFSLLSSFAILL